MNPLREHRPIHYKIADIEKQRKAAGAAPISTKVVDPKSRTYANVPIINSPSSAAANAARQQAVYQAANPGVAKLPAYDPSSAPGPIDVVTPGGTIGYDPRNFTAITDPETGQVTGVTPITQTPSIIPKGAPAGYVDVNGVGRSTNAGVQEDDATYAARLASIEQRNLALMQQEQLKQQMAQNKTQTSTIAPTTAASNTFNPYGNRTSAEGIKANLDRQSFIEQQRGLGKSDAEIRQMIQTMPPEQTGGVTPTPTTSSAPTPPPTTTGSTTPSTTTTTGSTTTTPKPTTTPTTPPQPSPQANILRNMAAIEVDPYTKLYLNSAADQLDAIGTPQDPMGQAEFLAGEDAKAISSPYDAIQGILNNANAQAKNSEASTKAFLQGQLNRTNAYNAAQKENIQNQLQFAADKAARDQTDANKKALDTQTIMLALRGGFGSADGNNEINEARLKGEEAIINLQKEFGFKKTDVSLKFTELHNQAFDNYQTSWLAATDNFEQKVNNIALQGISNQQAKGSALSGAYKDYVKEIKDSRIEYAKTVSDATKMVIETHDKLRDDQRSQESLGWQRMDWAAKTYGSDTPQAIIESISKQLPGVDVGNALRGMTLAEMKQKKISSGGGSGIVGGPSSAVYSDPTGVAGQYDNMNPQELRSAIDRAMLKFGGTGAERSAKRNEYLNRIASGESTGSIVSSLTADFWASKGTDKAHDDRLNAAGNMDTILSFAESYGITPENDGPLGKLDSAGNWFGSFVGLSSDAYNDLRSVVSNVRGQITKANAGTAVSAQELALLKEYAPSMDLKGPTFFANVQNYKQLVNYLDAKQVASDLGLPPPKIPTPIKMTGSTMVGPGKYSDSDINSALLD